MKNKLLPILMTVTLISALNSGTAYAACPEGQKNLHVQAGAGFSFYVKVGNKKYNLQNVDSSMDYCATPGDSLEIIPWLFGAEGDDVLRSPKTMPARAITITCSGSLIGNAECKQTQ